MAYPDSIAIRPRRSLAATLAALGFWLDVAALAALALAPAGWRLGLWHYIVSFELIRYSAYGGLLAGLVSLASLSGWARMPRLYRLSDTLGQASSSRSGAQVRRRPAAAAGRGTPGR